MFKTTEWDPAKYINSKEDVLAYLEAALEENDTELLLSVIGDIARSKGMAQIARELNVARESLYRSLSPEGNPSFSTVMQVLDILGFQLSLKQKATA
jgi:probable addiction module antidote protein